MFSFYRQLSTKCVNTFKYTAQQKRFVSQIPKGNPSADAARKKNLRSTLYYVTAGGVLVVGLSYAAVPLYRMFCQVGQHHLFKEV